MTDVSENENAYELRSRLVGAASEQELHVLALDSVEVALIAIADLTQSAVPRESVARLWGRLSVGEPLDAAEEVSQITRWIRPYLPPEEWEDQDDRTAVIRFAASVVDAAFDYSLPLRERASDAAFVLADLHSHIDGIAADQWAAEGVRVDIRQTVAGSGVSYDAYCMQRQNSLLKLLNNESGNLAPDPRPAPADRRREDLIADIREVTVRGSDFLHRALVALLDVGRI